MIPDRKLYVEAVAAEVAHDLMTPLNFFRTLVERSIRGEPFDNEDLEIAAQEITHIEGVLETLKRIAAHRLERAPVSLAELVKPFGEPVWQKLQVVVDPEVRLDCDARRLGIALEALVENALHAAGEGGRAGIEWQRDAENARLSVWDEGPGFREAPAFGRTSTNGRAGVGLTVARRTVRSHGWKLELGRHAERTFATIVVRTEDVLT